MCCNNGCGGGGNCCWIIILLIIIWCCCGSGVNAGVLTDGDAAMLQSAAFLRAQLVYISYYALEADLPDGSQSLADHLMDLGVFTRDEWRGSWKLVKSERL